MKLDQASIQGLAEHLENNGIADNTSTTRFVVGGRPRRAAEVDLRTVRIVVEKNGEPVPMAVPSRRVDE